MSPEFKETDLNCYQIDLYEYLDDEGYSFEIWAENYESDQWDYTFYLKEYIVATISKGLVKDISEI